MKKDKSESKKKHPLRKSLCQSFLLAMALGGLLVIIDYFDENGFVSQDYVFLRILFVIGIVGSILMFIKNYTSRNYMKIFIPLFTSGNMKFRRIRQARAPLKKSLKKYHI